MVNRLIQSFFYADEGIVSTINKERNMKIHVTTSLFVIIFSLILNISKTDTMFIIIAIGMVISAELFNTAIENTIDATVKGQHPLARVAKDAAAGGVLFVAFIAILIGVTVFYPYIEKLRTEGWVDKARDPLSFFVLFGLLIIISTYMLKAFWYFRKREIQPSLIVGLTFYLLSTLSIWLHSFFSIVLLLFIVVLLILERNKRMLVKVIQQMVISIAFLYLFVWLLY